MSLIKILLENTKPTKDELKKLIRKKFAKVISSDYFEQEGKKLEKENISFLYQKLIKEDYLIEKIYDADPSENNIYLKWIMRSYVFKYIEQYKTNLMEMFDEDYYKLVNHLKTFDENKIELKRLGHSTDINDYKSLPDLARVTFLVEDKRPKEGDYSIEQIMENDFFIKNNQAEVVYKEGNSLVVIPKTLEASKFYGCTTDWCTLYPENFNKYTKNGFLFIILNNNKKSQLFVPLDNSTPEYKDIFDYDVFSDIEQGYIILSFINEDIAEAIVEYVKKKSGYLTWDKKGIFDLDDYNFELEVPESGRPYIKFNGWEDLSFMLGSYENDAKEIFKGNIITYHTLKYRDINMDYMPLTSQSIKEIKRSIEEDYHKDVSFINENDGGQELKDYISDNKLTHTAKKITDVYNHVYNKEQNDRLKKMFIKHILSELDQNFSIDKQVEYQDYIKIYLEEDGFIVRLNNVVKILSEVVNMDELIEKLDLEYTSFKMPYWGWLEDDVEPDIFNDALTNINN